MSISQDYLNADPLYQHSKPLGVRNRAFPIVAEAQRGRLIGHVYAVVFGLVAAALIMWVLS